MIDKPHKQNILRRHMMSQSRLNILKKLWNTGAIDTRNEPFTTVVKPAMQLIQHGYADKDGNEIRINQQGKDLCITLFETGLKNE